jgi:hypothetical protein
VIRDESRSFARGRVIPQLQPSHALVKEESNDPWLLQEPFCRVSLTAAGKPWLFYAKLPLMLQLMQRNLNAKLPHDKTLLLQSLNFCWIHARPIGLHHGGKRKAWWSHQNAVWFLSANRFPKHGPISGVHHIPSCLQIKVGR